jgi:hypothetical protein
MADTFDSVRAAAGAVTVTVAFPETEDVCVLTAVTVTVPAVDGAVSFPVGSMLPLLAVHVTPGLNAPVPVTVAPQVAVAPVTMEIGEQETATFAASGFGATVTTADALFVVSCTDVAVMVTLPAVVGAVNVPLDEMVPAVAFQVTAELKLPVPVIVAAQADVAPATSVAGEQATVTAFTTGFGTICTLVEANFVGSVM